MLASTGSSPLARGLPDPEEHIPVAGGIIPARAGFTNPPFPGRYWRRGSSPLARGLHMRLEKGTVADRIIPARAGFTGIVLIFATSFQDHPRSRGVYRYPPACFREMLGSSPLARGLRGLEDGFGLLGRIIPARAGFTYARTPTRPQSADHPRSRGVYASSRAARPKPRGSSPLARGLRAQWASQCMW